MTPEPPHYEGSEHWEWVSFLGAGGFGEVWHVRGAGPRDEPGVHRAAKVIRGAGPDLQKVYGEFDVVRGLEHPRLVRQHQLLVEDQLAVIFMDYYPAGDLAALLKHRDTARTLAPAEAAELVADVAEGLAVLHAKNLVHHDVKPENILLAPGSGISTYRAVVSDFGLVAKHAGTRATPAHLGGTARYAAPERLMGGAGSGRSDVYAAGLILYEALCGQIPLAPAARATHRPGCYPGCPEQLWSVLRSLLEPDDRNRPNADAAAASLRGIATELEDSPRAPRLLVAPPPVPLTRGFLAATEEDSWEPKFDEDDAERPRSPRRRLLVGSAVGLTLLGAVGTAAALATGGSGKASSPPTILANPPPAAAHTTDTPGQSLIPSPTPSPTPPSSPSPTPAASPTFSPTPAQAIDSSSPAAAPRRYVSMTLANLWRNGGASSPQTVVIGQKPFTYVLAPDLQSFEYVDNEKDNVLWQVTSSSCRSLTLRVGTSTDTPIGIDSYDLPDTLKIMPQHEPNTIVHLVSNQVRTVAVRLTPGEAFAISLSGSFYIYLNGSGVCNDALTFS